MVVEVSKEVDLTRIGIDRYSLKTGLKIKSTMVLNTRVLKEPRGFIRIIQCIMAILAFSTTAGFDTSCSFSHDCPNGDDKDTVTYSFGYPFRIRNNVLQVPDECVHLPDETTHDNESRTITLPFDFSAISQFYVATGVLSFLYTLIILVVYVFLHQTYSSNPKIPVIDLALSVIISIFWLTGSSAWAQGVQNLKYYLHTENLFGFMPICDHNACHAVHEGEYAELNVSLIFGFSCFALWAAGLWFVYKETVFHTPAIVTLETTQNQQAAKGDGRV